MRHLLMALCIFAFVSFVFVSSVAAAPVEAPGVADIFEIEKISGSWTAAYTQLAFAPDGSLYASTWGNGVLRYDYDPDGSLANQIVAHSANSLGVAFHESTVHGLCLYLSTRTGNTGEIRRLTDDDDDGIWGEPGETDVAIVDDIPVGLHQVDQIQIRGNALYVGVGNRTNDGTDESSYSGTVCWIQDLDSVPSTPNAAGFTGADFFTSAIPYTSTATAKLIVHSGTTRNPFGLAFDGDGFLWMTNNQIDTLPVAQDELFRTFEKADFGFPAANSQVDWRTDAATIAAGFFAPQNLLPSLTEAAPDPGYHPDFPTPGAPPGGLGPHSSADGFCFYDGNELPLRFHKDAFIVRASTSDTSFTHLPETYQDLVAVDRRRGEVVQIADDFNRPLDAICDAEGNILVAEVGISPGAIHRVVAESPVTAAHPFAWEPAGDGLWTEDSAWDSGVPAADRLFPHEWGTARYAVTIDRPGADPLVTLDRDVTIETLLLADRLALGAGVTLTVDGTYTQPGALTVELEADPGRLDAGTATLSGELHLTLADGFVPAALDSFRVMSAAVISGTFSSVTAPPGVSIALDVSSTRVLAVVTEVATGIAVGPADGLPGGGPATPMLRLLGRNPVRPGETVRLSYRLSDGPSGGTARLELFDLRGRRAATLPPIAPGEGLLEIGPGVLGSLPSGVYFVRLTAGAESATERLVLLR